MEKNLFTFTCVNYLKGYAYNTVTRKFDKELTSCFQKI